MLLIYDLLVDLGFWGRQVRKSGHQTIFGTVNMHGSSFGPAVWRVAVWVVLFPLLDDVKACYLKVLRKVHVLPM